MTERNIFTNVLIQNHPQQFSVACVIHAEQLSPSKVVDARRQV